MTTYCEHFIQRLPQILILGFLAVTFLQAGIDKVLDWKGNLSFSQQHFSKTVLKSTVPMMLFTLLIFELLSGVFSGLGIFSLLTSGETKFGLIGAGLSATSFIMLLFGQRVAKDYVGAASLTGYFLIAVYGVTLLSS
jgi:putative oxidoreductase